jgi:hypothetical protein
MDGLGAVSASPLPSRTQERQRASEASLRQRRDLRSENQRLREENSRLKTQLAIAYGRQRALQAADRA